MTETKSKVFTHLPAKVGFQIGLETPVFEQYWSANIPLVPGTIGHFGTDRANSWDAFIVIKAEEEGRRGVLQVIFPRIRVDVTGKILIGHDKLNDPTKFEYVAKCTCEICTGSTFYCDCGAEEKNVTAYAKTFKEADSKAQFEVVTIKAPQFCWFEFPPSAKEMAVDLPLQHGCCLACRDSHA